MVISSERGVNFLKSRCERDTCRSSLVTDGHERTILYKNTVMGQQLGEELSVWKKPQQEHNILYLVRELRHKGSSEAYPYDVKNFGKFGHNCMW